MVLQLMNVLMISKKTILILKQEKQYKYLIIEGIFAKKVSSKIFDQKYYFLELKINKNECMKRAVQRDIKEGKNKLKMIS